jgi:putative hemolysin
LAGFFSAAYGASSISPYLTPVLVGWGIPSGVAGGLSTVVLTVLIAYCSLVLGELAPKRIAIQRNAGFAYGVAPILSGFATLMRPVIWLLSVSTNAVVRLLGGDPDKAAEEMSDEELRDIVSSHEGLPEAERHMLDDVLNLRGREISEVMRPRPEVSTLDATRTLRETAQEVRDQPYSRYPVTDSSIDDIVGFVHVRDLYDAEREDPEALVTTIARDIPFYPGSARVLATLTEMRANNHHIAVVVDEYGGTDGILTLEDLVEEVVGEIFDEYDAEEPDSDFHENGGTVDGRLNLQDFEEATGIELPRGSYDTVAGFLVEKLGRIPQVGDIVHFENLDMRVTRMERRRVAEIAVQIIAPPADETDED